MFSEHNFIVWGSLCKCGQECSILENKFHPWNDDDFVVKIKCPRCGEMVEVNKEKAAEFYNSKILSYYNDISGDVIDMGCGGGFLSEYAVQRDGVLNVYALDNDPDCLDAIKAISHDGKVKFIQMDISDLGKYFEDDSIDYIISRDVFMFTENPDQYFDDITRIVKKGIRQMGWYVSDSPRMKNKLLPHEIADELTKRGWRVEVEYLDWYKCGYFIRAERV